MTFFETILQAKQMSFNSVKIKFVLLALIMFAIFACDTFKYKEFNQPTNSEPVIPSDYFANNQSNYLAKEKLEQFSDFKKTWNTKVLGSFKERLLEKYSNKIEENYRFIWIPSFDNPIAIRIWRSGENQFLVVKKMNGEGFEMGKLTYERTRSLTKEEWLKFTNLIEESSFWNLPTVDVYEEPMPDGAYYVFEGKKNNQFHEVYRIMPKKEIREIGTYLLSLSELKTNYAEY